MQRPPTKVDMHIHSSFSDGTSTPEEIVKCAIEKGYQEICIVDHVRRTSEWVDRFEKEITELKRRYQGRIILHCGIEAKVINLQGEIDARPEFFSKVDLVLSAFHRIPKAQDEFMSEDEIVSNRALALERWFEAKMKLLENPYVDIFAHPSAVLMRHHIAIPSKYKIQIAQKASNSGKVFEINSKYHVPDEEFIRLLETNGVQMCFGSDSHSIEEIQ
jgi:putative hydrolase